MSNTESKWVRDRLPDADTTVLIRGAGDEYPIWPGYHDGAQWCSAEGGELEGPVVGWMELEDAAAVLDGNKPGERICEPSAGSKYAPLDGSRSL